MELSSSDEELTGKIDEKEWNDWEDEDDEPEEATKCLLCTLYLSSAAKSLVHCLEAHQFDFSALVNDKRLDVYQTIKLINYIRRSVGPHMPFAGLPEDLTVIWNDDSLLQPVVENDGLLMHCFDEDEDEDEALLHPVIADRRSDSDVWKKEYEDMKRNVHALLAEGDDQAPRDPKINLDAMNKEDDEYYVDSYSHVAIHEEMLRDKARTEAYRDFMYKNPQVFKDKVVLDIGCGTGILSMFAARAGAKKVFGIDFSTVAEQARLNVKENGLDGTITIIRGKVEEVTLPVDQVDIIISEWMAMFNTVLWARDRWLAPGGTVYPDLATMYIAGYEDQGRLGYWDDVYGFKMTAMKEIFVRESSVEVVPAAGVITSTAVIADFNMCTLQAGGTDFTSSFHLLAKRSGSIHALVSHFDVLFDAGCEVTVCLPTGPEKQPTHWKQTVFYFPEPVTVSIGQALVGTISSRTDTQKLRGLVVDVQWGVQDCAGAWVVPLVSKQYHV